MKMRLCLLMFVVDVESSFNKYVLLKDDNSIVYINVDEGSKPSEDLIKDKIAEITGITGHWRESTPKLIGLLDSKNHVDENGCRLFDLIYFVCLSGKNSLAEGYSWVSLKDGVEFLSPLTWAIIKYVATNI